MLRALVEKIGSSRTAILEFVVGLIALWFAVPVVKRVVEAMLERRTFPGDLEWMEGATLMTAVRLRDGLPIYGDPAVDYIPFIYPPGFAWLVSLYDVSYEGGRSLSIAAIGVAAAALVYGARRLGFAWSAALATVGLLAATWDDSGTFFDLVRTDSLALALLGWALVLGDGPTRAHTVASGLCLALAFTTKQHVAAFGLPIGIWHWRVHGWRRAALFAAASAGPALAFSGVMIVATEGRFFTWIARLATSHGIVVPRLIPGAQKECWQALPIITTAALAVPMWMVRKSYWAGVSFTALIVASLMRGHTGGYLNVLMPLMWVQALLPAVAAAGVGTSYARVLATLLVAAQCYAVRAEDLKRFLPQPGEAERILALVDELRDLPDPILIPHAPFYAHLAGKKGSFALISLWDIDHKRGVYYPDVAMIERAMADGYWPTAVVPDDKLGHDFTVHFRKDFTLKTRPVPTKTGWPMRIRSVWTHVDGGTTPP